MSQVVFCLGLCFLCLYLGNRRFLYLCKGFSLVLETPCAHSEVTDTAVVLFEVWILSFESGPCTDNF